MAKTTFCYRKVADLIPYARNARTHSPEQVAKLAGSIKEFGFLNPVIISSDGGILAGHGRILAAQKLGLEEVPCIAESHLTEAQKRAYILADNKMALDAGWDEELLAIELQDLEGLGVDLDVTGFSLDELEALLHEGEAPAPRPAYSSGHEYGGQYDEEEDEGEEEAPEEFKPIERRQLAHRCPRCGFEYDE